MTVGAQRAGLMVRESKPTANVRQLFGLNATVRK